MNPNNLTNENIWHIDFSRKERIAFLSSHKEPESVKNDLPAMGLPSQGICMIDVSTSGKGSIKSQLESRSGYRVPWWGLNCFIGRLFNPSATDCEILEAIEHRQHQREIKQQRRDAIHQQVSNAVRQDGYIKGMCCACRQMSFK